MVSPEELLKQQRISSGEAALLAQMPVGQTESSTSYFPQDGMEQSTPPKPPSSLRIFAAEHPWATFFGGSFLIVIGINAGLYLCGQIYPLTR